MFPEERRQWLVSRARTAGRLDVAAVSDELNVAVETIRRDLNLLEGHGLLRRVHGGAIPVERVGFEGALAARAGAMRDEKLRLAKAAADLIDDAESIYLDEGSTVQVLADLLPVDRPLTVVTNALPTAVALAARPNVSLYVLGGRVRNHTLGAVDHWATRMLGDLLIDLAFLGTNGISVERGLTTPDPAVAAVKATAVAAARRSVLVADSTKFGVDSFCRFAGVRDLEAIVTDGGLEPGGAAAYAACGVRLVQA
jgi:DeoR family transcriptional regulator, fructose operon transcriptional repressor